MGDPITETLAGGGGRLLQDALRSDDSIKKTPIPDTPQQRKDDFMKKFYASFGGAPNATAGTPVNQRFIDSLRGFYGGAPFENIAKNFSNVNTFLPRAKPTNGYRTTVKEGSAPFIPTGAYGLF